MAETDVNSELVKKIVKQVLAQSANGGDSTKKIFAFSKIGRASCRERV